MSKVLTSSRPKKSSSSSAASLHSLASGAGQASQAGHGHHVEPVIVELQDELDHNDEETAEFFTASPLDQTVTPSYKNAQETQPTSTPSSKISSLKYVWHVIYKKFGLKYLMTFFLMVIYTVVGAAAFLALEKTLDQERINKLHEKYVADRQAFARNLSIEIANFGVGNNKTLEKFIDDRLIDYDGNRGCVPSNETLWNFWHAMYFAGTIYTTIGYGDIFCRTKSGRVVTMIYSLVGIPLMLITLTDLGCLLLKLMFALTQFCRFCKARCSPSALIGPHPPGYDKPYYKTVRSDLKDDGGEMEVELMERGGAESCDREDEDIEDMRRREEEEFEHYLMRVPVLTALTTTIAWIFICAGLFCIWEDWDYFTSVYFFFISLSTVGLGDETPVHKDIMVATYAFVIIGLSLVSMCITVIQRRLEDLYLHLLQMILREYQRKLSEGQNQLGATVGMTQAWQKSKTARFLMPLLSKDKKKNVAQKFQDEAKAQGIVLPAVLRDLDPKSGVPAVLKVAEEKSMDGSADLEGAIGEAIQRATAKARALNEPVEEDFSVKPVNLVQAVVKEEVLEKAIVVQPTAILYDTDAQTDELEMEDKQEQTAAVLLTDAQTQSIDSSLAPSASVDATSQTPIVESNDTSVQCKIDESRPPTTNPCEEVETQTETPELTNETSQTLLVEYDDSFIQCHLDDPSQASEENETQTDALECTDAASQTPKIGNKEQEIQTHVYDVIAAETQTDQVQTKNQRLQTPVPEILEQEAQTDPLVLDLEQFQATGTLSVAPDTTNKTSWAKAKNNIRQAIKKARSSSKLRGPAAGTPTSPSLAGIEATPAMATWNDVVGEVDDDNVRFFGGDEDSDEEEDDFPRRASAEILHWDPVHGLHAEPQRKVGDLKRMFERQSTRRSRKQSKKHY